MNGWPPATINPRSHKLWYAIDPKSAIRCKHCGRIGDYKGWQGKDKPWPPPGWIEVHRTTTYGVPSNASGFYCSTGCAANALVQGEVIDQPWWLTKDVNDFKPPDHYCNQNFESHQVYPPVCKVCKAEGHYP